MHALEQKIIRNSRHHRTLLLSQTNNSWLTKSLKKDLFDILGSGKADIECNFWLDFIIYLYVFNAQVTEEHMYIHPPQQRMAEGEDLPHAQETSWEINDNIHQWLCT